MKRREQNWKARLRLQTKCPKKYSSFHLRETVIWLKLPKTIESYDQWVNDQSDIAEKLYGLQSSMSTLKDSSIDDKDRLIKILQESYETSKAGFRPSKFGHLEDWKIKAKYTAPDYIFKVRDKELKIKTHTESLSHSKFRK